MAGTGKRAQDEVTREIRGAFSRKWWFEWGQEQWRDALECG